MSVEGKKRIQSVDVLRGLTVALMIFVNNGHGTPVEWLKHSVWNGMTLCDMVFPMFIFLMGLSINFSHRATVGAILRRALTIILICWGIQWLSWCCKGDWWPWGHIRLTGVLVRIALTYVVTALLCRRLSVKALARAAGGLLVLYSALLLLGNGYANDSSNILAVVDHAVIGPKHLYTKTPIDPEGLLGTVSSVAHALLGYLCGLILLDKDESYGVRLRRMGLYGVALLAAGLLVSVWMPLNKRIWSPSFVLVNCGAGALVLAALAWLVDVKGIGKWSRWAEKFGRNALAAYIFSEILEVLAGASGLSDMLYGALSHLAGNSAVCSLIYASIFVLTSYIFVAFWYKKRHF